MEAKFPMRINQYLAKQGYSTRRGADELVKQSKVTINGRPAVLGDKVNEADKVEVKSGRTAKPFVYYAYNKPRGVVTHSAEDDDDDIADVLAGDAAMKGVFPVGRLDKDSYGLIILTNDGRITDRLLNPDRVHDKEYVVRVREDLRDSFAKHMEAGVEIEDYTTRPARVRKTGDRTFAITLTEGKKHQIRRMVSALHNEVEDLKRVRIMNIELGGLPASSYRAIEGEELAEFLAALDLTKRYK